jgi:hypothetical protein
MSIDYSSLPTKNCGCIVHLRRLGYSDICCGEECDLEKLKFTVYQKLPHLSRCSSEIRFAVRTKLIEDNGEIKYAYTTFSSNIPESIQRIIKYIKRPLVVFVALKSEDDLRQSLDMSRMIKGEWHKSRSSIRKFSIVNRFNKSQRRAPTKNALCRSKHEEVDMEISIFDFE